MEDEYENRFVLAMLTVYELSENHELPVSEALMLYITLARQEEHAELISKLDEIRNELRQRNTR